MKRPLAMTALILSLLAACQSDEVSMPRLTGLTPGDPCTAERYGGLIGAPRSAAEDLARELRTGGLAVRVLGPMDPATMDLNEDRLNILLDAQGRIRALSCG